MKSKISLIISAYNEEKYIGDCLKSVLENLDYFSEVIVVDNASTDRTAEISKSFNVKVVSEMRKGVTRARQRGFLESAGELLVFIDADTRLPKGWIEKVINEFRCNDKIVCVSGPYVYYDQSVFLQFITKYFYWYALAMPIYMLVGYMAMGGNFVIKREVMERMNGFDTDIEFYGDDTDSARRASAFGKVSFSPKFSIFSSNRRLDGQGVLRTTFLYVVNFLSGIFFKKPVTKRYEDVR